MGNYIDMVARESILQLHKQGYSKRRIAKELALNRETVSRYIRLGSVESGMDLSVVACSNQAKVPAGITDISDSNQAKVPAGISRSLCAPYHAEILDGIERGLTAQRIYQDLCSGGDFVAGYDSVKRYVRQLSATESRVVKRVECAAGDEAQVDFGTGAYIVTPDGRRKRSWVFRIVLSCSRKGFSEAVFRQTTDSFIQCLENAFRYFGGVTRLLVLDNLRAAVKKADWCDPEFSPKFASFCNHYGVVPTPTRVYTPQHKGKIERGIGYVKGNALKGRVFGSLAEENLFLRQWEQNVADNRIHGTIRRHVGSYFETHERHALLPLPTMLFPSFEEGRRRVHRDAYIEVKRAYYRVPDEYIGRDVWVRWDARTIRVFNSNMEQVAIHAVLEDGQFSASATGRKATTSVVESIDYWCQRVGEIGPRTEEWALRLYDMRIIATEFTENTETPWTALHSTQQGLCVSLVSVA